MAEKVTPQVEDVHGSGVYPAGGPFPSGEMTVRSPAALGHPEERRTPGAGRPSLETAALLAGRALFGGYFLYNGISHFAQRQTLVEYARSKGVPAPGLAVAVSGLLILAGGASILTGAQPKLGAAAIMTFLLGVSPQMHAFWKEQDAERRMNEMVNFTKNMALVGGSLLAAARPEPWPWRAAATSRGGALVPVRG